MTGARDVWPAERSVQPKCWCTANTTELSSLFVSRELRWYLPVAEMSGGSTVGRFVASLRNCGLGPSDRVAVALSGGPDSLALASLTVWWQGLIRSQVRSRLAKCRRCRRLLVRRCSPAWALVLHLYAGLTSSTLSCAAASPDSPHC